eukprot:1840501-Rhodomonas_salina.1
MRTLFSSLCPGPKHSVKGYVICPRVARPQRRLARFWVVDVASSGRSRLSPRDTARRERAAQKRAGQGQTRRDRATLHTNARRVTAVAAAAVLFHPPITGPPRLAPPHPQSQPSNE